MKRIFDVSAVKRSAIHSLLKEKVCSWPDNIIEQFGLCEQSQFSPAFAEKAVEMAAKWLDSIILSNGKMRVVREMCVDKNDVPPEPGQVVPAEQLGENWSWSVDRELGDPCSLDDLEYDAVFWWVTALADPPTSVDARSEAVFSVAERPFGYEREIHPEGDVVIEAVLTGKRRDPSAEWTGWAKGYKNHPTYKLGDGLYEFACKWFGVEGYENRVRNPPVQPDLDRLRADIDSVIAEMRKIPPNPLCGWPQWSYCGDVAETVNELLQKRGWEAYHTHGYTLGHAFVVIGDYEDPQPTDTIVDLWTRTGELEPKIFTAESVANDPDYYYDARTSVIEGLEEPRYGSPNLFHHRKNPPIPKAFLEAVESKGFYLFDEGFTPIAEELLIEAIRSRDNFETPMFTILVALDAYMAEGKARIVRSGDLFELHVSMRHVRGMEERGVAKFSQPIQTHPRRLLKMIVQALNVLFKETARDLLDKVKPRRKARFW